VLKSSTAISFLLEELTSFLFLRRQNNRRTRIRDHDLTSTVATAGDITPNGSTQAKVFNAEAAAALAGVNSALTLLSTKYASELWSFLDNLEVAPATWTYNRIIRKYYGTCRFVLHQPKIVGRFDYRVEVPHRTLIYLRNQD